MILPVPLFLFQTITSTLHHLLETSQDGLEAPQQTSSCTKNTHDEEGVGCQIYNLAIKNMALGVR